MNPVTRWEDWRTVVGPSGSRHRKAVMDQLQTPGAAVLG